ncbi:Ancylostoma secreted protein, partial [Toxocara canis]
YSASGIECPNVANPVFNATMRAAVVAKHNEFRAMLTHGTAEYKGGHKLPSGKNIYQMEWDCALEKHAQDWSNNCIFKHSDADMGENLFKSSPLPLGAVTAVESWWAELKQYDASGNPKLLLNDGVFKVAGHWSQVAWGATTQVGCGITNCGPDKFIMVTCNYLVAGNMQGAVIFQLGDGCSSDSECTTYPESKCNVTSKLCIHSLARRTLTCFVPQLSPCPRALTESTLVESTPRQASGIECPNVANPVLNATIRAAVVAKHNELRATLTHGTAEYKGGHKLPSGKNIYQMVWDCDLEKHAQDWSNKCEFKHSDADMGENLFQSSPLSVEKGGVAAVEDWWSELQNYDASGNPNMDFNDDVFAVAGHWSQLAWGATTKVGCGLANCGSGGSAFIKVTCNYVIAGNMEGAVIFQPGNGCTADSECTTYPESKCNVTSKLCM